VSDDDIANAFDGITYEKGAAVIEMFEHSIGSDTFRKGVRQYVKQHADGNATTADFLSAISAAAGKDISPAFNTFLEQAGVPLLTVSLDCGGAKPVLKISQKRSLPLGSPGSAAQTWQVPACVKYESGGELYSQCEVLAGAQSEMTLKRGKACPGWVLANDGEVGYYRVDYEGQLLDRMLGGDNASHLTVPEQVGLLGDVQALVSSAQISPKVALALVPKFHNDPQRQVVESALRIAELTVSRSVPDDLQEKGSAYIRTMFGERALKLGWHPDPNEPDSTRLLRLALVPEVASDGEQKELIGEADKMARAWLKGDKTIAPDLVGSVLRVAAEFGDRDLFDQFLAAAKKEQDRGTREKLIGALGSFRNPAIVNASLELVFDKDFDVRETFYRMLFGPLQYRETRALPFEFVKANMDRLLARLPREVGADFTASLPEVGQGFCDAEHRAAVKGFFEEKVKDFTGGPRNLAKTLESIDVCIAKKKALGPELADFLRGQ
jgi:alanyl aminopeptidase